MENVRFIRTKLPRSIKGLAVKSTASEGDFYTALINEDLPEEATRKAVLHEIRHIMLDDFRSEESVSDIEKRTVR